MTVAGVNAQKYKENTQGDICEILVVQYFTAVRLGAGDVYEALGEPFFSHLS